MSLPSINQIVEFLKMQHYDGDIEQQKTMMINRSRTFFYISLVVIIVTSIFFLYLLLIDNLKIQSSLATFFSENKNSVIINIVLFLIFLLGFLCYSNGILRFAKQFDEIKDLKSSLSDDFSGIQKAMLDRILGTEGTLSGQISDTESTLSKEVKDLSTEISNNIKEFVEKNQVAHIKQCGNCDRYSDSSLLIETSIRKYCDNHSTFIDFYKSSTNKKTEKLVDIQDDFEEHEYAKLLCVLLNPNYLDKGEEEVKTLTHYFMSFFPQLKLYAKEKRIRRIFCKSALCDNKPRNLTKRKKRLLEFILINYLTGVETCFLIDEEELNCHLDYVIGKYPDQESKYKSVRKYYFSDSDSNSDTIQGKDQLLCNILERDFYERWYGNKKKVKRRRILVKSSSKIKEVIEELGLSTQDVQDTFSSLETHINSCTRKEFENQENLLGDLKIELKKTQDLINKNEIQKK